MNSQIRLLISLAGREGCHTVEILIDGDTPVAGLLAAVMTAIYKQHPHYSGEPITAIKYDVKANAHG